MVLITSTGDNKYLHIVEDSHASAMVDTPIDNMYDYILEHGDKITGPSLSRVDYELGPLDMMDDDEFEEFRGFLRETANRV